MKKTFIRIIAAALALCGMMLLVGCDNGKTPADTTTSGGVSDESTTEQVTSEAPEKHLNVVVDGKAQLIIIRPEKASKVLIESCIALNNKMSKFLSTSFKINDDWVRRDTTPDPDAAEILVGETNRQATADFLAKMPPDSYGIKVTEHQIVIVGTNDTMTSLALYDFESNYIRNKENATDNGFSLALGETIVTDSSLCTFSAVMASKRTVMASISNTRQQKSEGQFSASQGAATDGTYFYIILKSKVGDLETDIIVKRRMDDWSLVATSEELPLDHANDMCYNSKDNVLVVPNMKGKIISIIDPETLTVLRQVDATELGGTPYAISYNAQRDRYCIAAGGQLNICTRDFHVESAIGMHSEPTYVGQGMDCDDDYIYMPLSANSSKGTDDNIIIVYSWTDGFKRVIHLNETMESETLLNYDGKYYINFNSGGSKICDLRYDIVYK